MFFFSPAQLGSLYSSPVCKLLSISHSPVPRHLLSVYSLAPTTARKWKIKLPFSPSERKLHCSQTIVLCYLRKTKPDSGSFHWTVPWFQEVTQECQFHAKGNGARAPCSVFKVCFALPVEWPTRIFFPPLDFCQSRNHCMSIRHR